MTRSDARSLNFLTLLLGGVLALSLGLNALLMAGWIEAWPDDVSAELAATTADLHQTQRLLASCQQHQQQQDSLLTLTRHLAPGPSLVTQ
ncbi:hypothetical protein JAO73_12710 [Hymenobacter sp. BT523]|uniref:hypothetical protein n=1 Tax=Hymenobacter sp. BT523 TaxID=2795725 RepID=UPI0018ED7A50|nr:hypothetical protein [Hymenobacter sp. BT523]MBJ6109876.1 hypothetical protein [Hymenobacter sp. BT523]